jgi:hypothetical protein
MPAVNPSLLLPLAVVQMTLLGTFLLVSGSAGVGSGSTLRWQAGEIQLPVRSTQSDSACRASQAKAACPVDQRTRSARRGSLWGSAPDDSGTHIRRSCPDAS